MAESSSGLGKNVVTSLAAEMKEHLAGLAGPFADSDTRESWLARAARRAGISYRQAKAIFYGETRDPRASIVEQLRRARAAGAARNSENIERLRDDVAKARAVLEVLEARVAAFDADQDRPVVGFDRPRDRGADRP